LSYSEKKTDLSAVIYGQDSETYCEGLYEKADILIVLRKTPEARLAVETLIRLYKELSDGEEDLEVMKCYSMMAEVC
jgi:hypothetical protein